jgi:hypothetical protein
MVKLINSLLEPRNALRHSIVSLSLHMGNQVRQLIKMPEILSTPLAL